MVDPDRRRLQVNPMVALVVNPFRWCRCEHARLPLVVLPTTTQSAMTLFLPLDSRKCQKFDFLNSGFRNNTFLCGNGRNPEKQKTKRFPKYHSDRAVLGLGSKRKKPRRQQLRILVSLCWCRSNLPSIWLVMCTNMQNFGRRLLLL